MRIACLVAAVMLLWAWAPSPAHAQLTATERLMEAKDLLRKKGVPCEVERCTELALRNLRALLKEYPDAPEAPFARYLCGVSLIRLERYKEAAEVLQDALQGPVDSRGKENILYHLAFCYLHSLDQVKARENYEAFLREFPQSRNANDAKKLLGPLKLIGSKAPLFKAEDINGQPLDLKGFIGRPLLIHFWATWCPPDRQDLPNIKKAYDQFHEKGLEFVGVSLDTDTKALAEHLKAQAIAWPQYCDGKKWDSPVARIYNVSSIPMVFLMDRRGIVRYVDLRDETLFKAIGLLLQDGQ
ncbi:MAG: redoxin domain-containing protein [Planctomycetes bacterium]|nr:redoxin domain-containing protein [Planctomycetota bacterium]